MFYVIIYVEGLTCTSGPAALNPLPVHRTPLPPIVELKDKDTKGIKGVLTIRLKN